jgi:UDPglucose 6-dehydrogenase
MKITDGNFFNEFNHYNHWTVGQIGHGYIGQAVVELFKDDFNVVVYDKAKPELNSLEDVVGRSHVIFVAVPTPMEADGTCHTGIVESVLQDIQNTAVKIDRDVEDFVVVIKSTVPPGFTEKMSVRFALRIVFSPEFLTEKNSVNDFKTSNRLILGGDQEDSSIVYKFFERVWIDRTIQNFVDHPDGPVNILAVDSTTAELVKYFTNVYLTTVVTFANEFYQVCKAFDRDYDIVKILGALDHRISPSHLDVPGHDGNFGFGGSCFPKDINSLRSICAKMGIPERLFTAIIERNNELRPSKDWEQLKGRAVVG